jgi:hypothetical protein
MTTTQHLQALAYANEIRTEGARIRREMAALGSHEGLHRAAELLRDPPEEIARMRLGHFLRGIHRVGNARLHSFMRAATIPMSMEERVVGPCAFDAKRQGISDRQRLQLADVLDTIAEGLL